MRGIAVLISACLLSACSTSISYAPWSDGKQIESTALHFSLPSSKITLSAPVPTGPDGKPASKPTSNCPADVTDDTWYACFNQVNAASVMSPPDAAYGSYVATPDDGKNWDLTTTAISGTAVTGQDTLYSIVTVKYTSNAAAVITAAGSGAVTGFGIAGPYGAAGGLVLGIVQATVANNPGSFNPDAVPPPAPTVSDYICDKDKSNIDYSKMAGVKPSAVFPINVVAEGRAEKAGAPVFAPSSQLDHVDLPAKPDSAGNYPEGDNSRMCWHALPNASQLGIVSPVAIGSARTNKGPRVAVSGDGWLYRIVEKKSVDAEATEAGAKETAGYFADPTAAHSDFPYPLCRKVVVQVTWWKAFSNALAAANASAHAANAANPLPPVPAVTFETTVADPRYVQKALLKKGGVINFRPDCGANVTTTVDTSNAAILNAAVTATENLYKAEQTWAAGQKKK